MLSELSSKLTPLIGFPIMADNIYPATSNDFGWSSHVQNLKPGFPVFIMQFRGLTLVLPLSDWRRLRGGSISIDDYIKQSHWNYGYYQERPIKHAYWQPLEIDAGINDTAKISQYLHTLSCRAYRALNGFAPTVERCKYCALTPETCRFSPLHTISDWDEEIPEPDGRADLFAAIGQRLQSEIGKKFHFTNAIPHERSSNEVVLYPGYSDGSAFIQISRTLTNDILYHPTAPHNWDELAATLDITYATDDREMYNPTPPSQPKYTSDGSQKRSFFNFKRRVSGSPRAPHTQKQFQDAQQT